MEEPSSAFAHQNKIKIKQSSQHKKVLRLFGECGLTKCKDGTAANNGSAALCVPKAVAQVASTEVVRDSGVGFTANHSHSIGNTLVRGNDDGGIQKASVVSEAPTPIHGITKVTTIGNGDIIETVDLINLIIKQKIEILKREITIRSLKTKQLSMKRRLTAIKKREIRLMSKVRALRKLRCTKRAIHVSGYVFDNDAYTERGCTDRKFTQVVKKNNDKQKNSESCVSICHSDEKNIIRQELHKSFDCEAKSRSLSNKAGTPDYLGGSFEPGESLHASQVSKPLRFGLSRRYKLPYVCGKSRYLRRRMAPVRKLQTFEEQVISDRKASQVFESPALCSLPSATVVLNPSCEACADYAKNTIMPKRATHISSKTSASLETGDSITGDSPIKKSSMAFQAECERVPLCDKNVSYSLQEDIEIVSETSGNFSFINEVGKTVEQQKTGELLDNLNTSIGKASSDSALDFNTASTTKNSSLHLQDNPPGSLSSVSKVDNACVSALIEEPITQDCSNILNEKNSPKCDPPASNILVSMTNPLLDPSTKERKVSQALALVVQALHDDTTREVVKATNIHNHTFCMMQRLLNEALCDVCQAGAAKVLLPPAVFHYTESGSDCIASIASLNSSLTQIGQQIFVDDASQQFRIRAIPNKPPPPFPANEELLATASSNANDSFEMQSASADRSNVSYTPEPTTNIVSVSDEALWEPPAQSQANYPLRLHDLKAEASDVAKLLYEKLASGVSIKGVSYMKQFEKAADDSKLQYREMLFDVAEEAAENIFCVGRNSSSNLRWTLPPSEQRHHFVDVIVESMLATERSKTTKQRCIWSYINRHRMDSIDLVMAKELRDEEKEWVDYSHHLEKLYHRTADKIIKHVFHSNIGEATGLLEVSRVVTSSRSSSENLHACSAQVSQL